MQHRGSEWLRSANRNIQLSTLGAAVADLLGDVFCGIYHLDRKELFRTCWDDPYIIEHRLNYRSLATFDGNHLTALVVLSHDRCLRLDIRARRPQVLELLFHQRQRTGAISERMPTMEDHIRTIRLYRPVDPL